MNDWLEQKFFSNADAWKFVDNCLANKRMVCRPSRVDLKGNPTEDLFGGEWLVRYRMCSLEAFLCNPSSWKKK